MRTITATTKEMFTLSHVLLSRPRQYSQSWSFRYWKCIKGDTLQFTFKIVKEIVVHPLVTKPPGCCGRPWPGQRWTATPPPWNLCSLRELRARERFNLLWNRTNRGSAETRSHHWGALLLNAGRFQRRNERGTRRQWWSLQVSLNVFLMSVRLE